ncbi:MULTISPECIES: hypothetical protein [unclassified Streptomyces]|uniref:hypothetical protein n=1 Tax=unclassified Streptomyces TaxID=2593676 RepID=UPI003D73C86F
MKLSDLVRPLSRTAGAVGDRVRRTTARSARNRRLMTHQFLRGVSYGAGTSVATFVVWWLRARYGG